MIRRGSGRWSIQARSRPVTQGELGGQPQTPLQASSKEFVLWENTTNEDVT